MKSRLPEAVRKLGGITDTSLSEYIADLAVSGDPDRLRGYLCTNGLARESQERREMLKSAMMIIARSGFYDGIWLLVNKFGADIDDAGEIFLHFKAHDQLAACVRRGADLKGITEKKSHIQPGGDNDSIISELITRGDVKQIGLRCYALAEENMKLKQELDVLKTMIEGLQEPACRSSSRNLGKSDVSSNNKTTSMKMF